MLRLNFASRGFYFCKHYAAFARAVIYQPAAQRDFGRLIAQRDFSELRILRASGVVFYVLRGAILQTGGASAVFAGRDFELAVQRSFQTAIL